MNITSIAILLSLVTLAAAETRSLRERRLEFAIKRAEYEDLLVKTLDKIITPCEDPNACEEDETCEETETYSIAGFTCNPAEPPEVKDTTVSKLERLLKEIEN
ncbi:uncharacterized protein [Ptychodera flava]|uniref:uncharacterized protein isoform X2 n=1 Tax=Ptychodera flava TaxID=63121 RepID=UPI00396A3DD0